MQIVNPVALFVGIKEELGERVIYTAARSSYTQFRISRIFEKLNDVLLQLWRRMTPHHGHTWETIETVTMVSDQEDYTISDQGYMHAPIRAVDNDDYHIKIISYHDKMRYDDEGTNCIWFRQDPATPGSLIMGVMYPNTITSIELYKERRPKLIVGGQGLTTGVMSLPYWAKFVASYYTVNQDYIDRFTISNGEVGTVSNALITTSGASSLTCSDWAAVTSDDDIWCVRPEWAPEAAKDLICKLTAKALLEGTELGVSNVLREGIALADLEFRRGYTPAEDRGVEPYRMKDWY